MCTVVEAARSGIGASAEMWFCPVVVFFYETKSLTLVQRWFRIKYAANTSDTFQLCVVQAVYSIV